MVFWKEIHALFHFWWLSGYSNPSALCGQTWSLDKPPLKTMWIFMHTPPPFISKILEFFLIFESKASIKLTVQYKCLFWIYWFQIASYLHLFASIWANKKSTWISAWDPPPPMWIYMVIWRTPPPPLVIHMVYGCSLSVINFIMENIENINIFMNENDYVWNPINLGS